MIKFSVITVSYNAGQKLLETVQSVLKQTYSDFEIIVKDASSTDSSVEALPKDERIRTIVEKDRGIYNGMNAALPYITGDYVLFLNCGDYLFSDDVFENLNAIIEQEETPCELYYGDVFVRCRGGVISNKGKLTDYRLMSRTICHQTILFKKSVFEQNAYLDSQFSLAADMELYVRCLKKDRVQAKHIPMIVVNYEGGGVSETVQHKKKILNEKKQILEMHFTKKERLKVKLLKCITLKTLKEQVGSCALTYRFYEKIASLVSRRKNKNYGVNGQEK